MRVKKVKRLCWRCGVEEKADVGCSAWGEYWERHLFIIKGETLTVDKLKK